MHFAWSYMSSWQNWQTVARWYEWPFLSFPYPMSFRVTPELYALVLIAPNLLALLLKRGWEGFTLFFEKEMHGTNGWKCPYRSVWGWTLQWQRHSTWSTINIWKLKLPQNAYHYNYDCLQVTSRPPCWCGEEQKHFSPLGTLFSCKSFEITFIIISDHQHGRQL